MRETDILTNNYMHKEDTFTRHHSCLLDRERIATQPTCKTRKPKRLRRQRRGAALQSGMHAKIDSTSGVISVREPGKRGEHAARHRVDGPRQRNLQQDAFRAGAARELEDEVVRPGRARGA